MVAEGAGEQDASLVDILMLFCAARAKSFQSKPARRRGRTCRQSYAGKLATISLCKGETSFLGVAAFSSWRRVSTVAARHVLLG
jgi:hypothetical protein